MRTIPDTDDRALVEIEREVMRDFRIRDLVETSRVFGPTDRLTRLMARRVTETVRR